MAYSNPQRAAAKKPAAPPSFFGLIYQFNGLRILLAVVMAASSIGLIPSGEAQAATLTVTSTANSGAGTLRQAIADAVDGDTISFSLTTPATITLTSQIEITKEVTLNGPGTANLTISGGGTTRIFYVSAGKLRLNNLTIANGKIQGSNAAGQTPGTVSGLGGAVYIASGAGVTATNVVFNNNQASGGNGGNSVEGDGYYGGAGGGAGGASGVSAQFGGGGVGGGADSDQGGTGGFGGGGGGSSGTAAGGVAGFGGGNGGSGPKEYGFSGGGGGGALGGAVFIAEGGALGLKNVTLTNNSVTGGAGGSAATIFGGAGGGGGAGLGSAIFNGGELCIDTGVTFSGNTATGGAAGSGKCGFGAGDCPGPAAPGTGADTTPGYYDYSNNTSCAVFFNRPTNITFTPASLSENSAAGSVAGALSSSDLDAGDTFTYSLVSGTGGEDNASFAISGSNLITAAVLDYEAKSNYQVRVRTTDSHNLWFEKAITVSIINGNDAPSGVTLTPASLQEGAAAGTLVGSLATNDPDGAQTHTYTLVNPGGACSGSDNASFSLTGSSLRSAAVFDYETKSSYTICVRSTDNGSPAMSLDQQLTIAITNTNESPTAIGLSAATIDENQASGTAVGIFSTTDPDAGETFTYSLAASGTECAGSDNASFTVSAGGLFSNAVFNYEVKNSYSICVKSQDSGGSSVYQAFSIQVEDVNEVASAIVLSNDSLAENSAANSLVGSLSANDPDEGQTHQFVLADAVSGCDGSGNGSFTVSGDDLFSSEVFDHEVQSSYAVCVRATDNGDPVLSREQSFTISVGDVNEAPTNLTLSTASLNENQPVDATIGSLSTSDPDDGDTHTYTLENPGGACSGADNSAFTITGASLKTTLSFNYEVKNSYTICVRSTDSGSLSFDRQITISVLDVNETPYDLNLSAASISENQPAGTEIGVFSAADVDSGQTLGFSLVDAGGACSGADNGAFTIAGDRLKSANEFNFESKSTYSICVRVSDDGSPAASTDRPFTIEVLDVNEAPADLALSSTTIAENLAAGSLVGLISTTESDAGQTVSYALTTDGGACSDSDLEAFTISGNELRTAVVLNYEEKSTYPICIQATDNGSPAASVVGQFSISVANANDAPIVDSPLSDQERNAGEVYEFVVPAGTFSDPDGDELTLAVDLLGGTALPGWLSFDPATNTLSGTLMQAGTLDVRVTASDGHGGSVADVYQLVIQALTENHNPVVVNPIPNSSGRAGFSFSTTFSRDTFADRDGDGLAYQASLDGGGALPSWLSFDADSRTFSGTPGAGDVGLINVRVTALDGKGGEASTVFQLGIDQDVAPSVANLIPDQAGRRGEPWIFQFAENTFIDSNGDPITYSADLADGSALPGWMMFDPDTRTFSGVPPVDVSDFVYDVRVTATSGTPSLSAVDVFRFSPWVAQTNDSDFPSGSLVVINNAPTAGPALPPNTSARLYAAIDLEIQYDNQPVSELTGDGIPVCFLVGPAELELVGGNLSKFVIGTSHAGGPWQLLQTYPGSQPNQICANSAQFSLFELFIRAQEETDVQILPSTGFHPNRLSQPGPQPAQKAYSELDQVWVEIPALKVKTAVLGVPTADGTWDVSWLANQLGWLEGSAFPGLEGNSVLTGHVYDANGKPGVLVGLRGLKWGDTIIVHAFGMRYTYMVQSVEAFVSPKNLSVLRHEDSAWLTLITCQGYDPNRDEYRWRSVVRAALAAVEAE